MSFADRREPIGTAAYWLNSWPLRYGFALVTAALATLLRYPLSQFIGSNLPFILFYPSILLVAWLAGLWPGVFTVFLSAVSTEYLLFRSSGPAGFGLPINANGLILFTSAGVAISGVADVYRRHAQRLREFERAAGGVEEGIIVLDRQYRYVVANRAFLGYRGLKKEQLLGRSLAETLGASVFETTVKPKLDECFQGKVVRYEKRYQYPAIGERDFSVSYFPIEGPTGVDRVACIMQDITEKKQAERALQLFRTLIDQSNDAVQVVDAETLRLLDVNEKACKDLGYTREELLSMTVGDIDRNADASCYAAVMDKLRTAGFVVKETVHRRKDGSTFPVETSLKYVPLDQNYVVAVSRDISERKHADDALRERDEKFHQVADNIQEIFWMVDTASKQAIYVNPAFERITGRTVTSLVEAPLSYREIIHPDDRARVLDHLSEAAVTGKLDEEFRIVRADRAIRWVEAHGFPVYNAEGQIYRLAGVVQDITARRLAEEGRRYSEERYRDLVEHSEDLLCTHDLEGNLVSVNPAPARILGYSVEELLKIPMRDLLVPEGRPPFEEYLQRLRTTGQPENGLLCVMTRSGEIRTWEYRNTLRTEGVATPIVRGMAHDVTQKRRAELALRDSEQRYRLLFEKNVAGVALASMEGQILDCNDAWGRMLGYSGAEELRGRETKEFYFDLADREPLQHEFARNNAILGRELRLRRKDGAPVWVLFDCAALSTKDGAKVIQATAIDISERKRAEEAMRQSEERFRVALKDSPITVFNQDQDLRYTWIYNPHLYWQHEIVGKTDAELIGTAKAAQLDDLKRRVLKTRTAVREEVQIPHDGKNYAFDITIEPLFDADGNVAGITGASMDIARLRERADRLQDAKEKLAQEKSYLESEIQSELGFEKIIGRSPALRDVLKKARIVAPTDSTVLLLGETGTGKELVARSVHSLSTRHDKNFIKLNCAAVPSGLLESELFGHEKGAFTSAISQKIGRIELADKGTLFLDEIGELPVELQPKLLRVLQDREFERLGGVRTLHVDVRIIAATNRDLQQDITEKKFREDLFYRLNVFPIQMPPLRERRCDIPMLVHHFVHKHAVSMGRHIGTIPDETIAVLRNWNWPGNIRELENMIERMVIMTKGGVLAPPPAELEAPQEAGDDDLSEMEREHILRVLRETNGVLSGAAGAASRLGIKRTTLQSMLKRFGIGPEDYRRGMA